MKYGPDSRTHLTQLAALLILYGAESAHSAVFGCRQQHGSSSAVECDTARRCSVASPEAQAPRRAVCIVKDPLPQCVVCTRAHEQRLPGKEVQACHRRGMRILDDRLKLALIQVPDGDDSRCSRGREQRWPGARAAAACAR